MVDNWVAQWGDGEDDSGKARPLPEGLGLAPEQAYSTKITGDKATPRLKLKDPYAPAAFFWQGWPVAMDSSTGQASDVSAWPIHCYGSVGVARDLAPDTGTGAELYAVIGHAPRQLDRNIAVIGQVIEGIEHLSTLPRGTADAGVYATQAERTPILSVRLVGELLPAEQPRFEYLATESDSFAHYLAVRANRQDEFYRVPAGGVDVCNVQVPIRRIEHDRQP